jgi:hypothetical protein
MLGNLTVYLHFPCFDGVISAVLAGEYMERKHGLALGEIVPVNYSEQTAWISRELQKPAAVVDYPYHPEADFWADHHPTTFLDPILELELRDKDASSFLYDPTAASCAEVIWRRSYRLLREPRFREMVQWARRIDSARYASVQEAMMGDAPALRINQSLLEDSSADYCKFLVQSLRAKNLDEVAAEPRVQTAYRRAQKATVSGQKLFRKSARLEEDKIVVFNTGKASLNRYAPYLEYPAARYSVGIFETGDGAKITAMRNPWRRFKSVPLGTIFSRYGGGGHQRVASVLVKDVDEAQRTLKDILSDMRALSSQATRTAEVSAG